MKKTVLYLLTAFLVLSLSACVGEKGIAGIYKAEGDPSVGWDCITFSTDGTCRLSGNGAVTVADYGISEDILEIYSGGSSKKFSYSRNRDILSLYEAGSSDGTTYRKAGNAPKTCAFAPSKESSITGVFGKMDPSFSFDNDGTVLTQGGEFTYSAENGFLSINTYAEPLKHCFEIDGLGNLILFDEGSSKGELFLNLSGSFSESDEKYREAIALYQDYKCEEAKEIFDTLGEYLRSGQLSDLCQREIDYQRYDPANIVVSLADYGPYSTDYSSHIVYANLRFKNTGSEKLTYYSGTFEIYTKEGRNLLRCEMSDVCSLPGGQTDIFPWTITCGGTDDDRLLYYSSLVDLDFYFTVKSLRYNDEESGVYDDIMIKRLLSTPYTEDEGYIDETEVDWESFKKEKYVPTVFAGEEAKVIDAVREKASFTEGYLKAADPDIYERTKYAGYDFGINMESEGRYTGSCYLWAGSGAWDLFEYTAIKKDGKYDVEIRATNIDETDSKFFSVTASPNLRIRKTSDPVSEQIGKVQFGSIVYVAEKENGMCRIIHNGTEGWVSADYLEAYEWK